MAEQDLMERIRHRAYEIWLSEGCPHGRDRIHWLRAEAEFSEKLAPADNRGLHKNPMNKVGRQPQSASRKDGSRRKERKR